MRYRIFDIAKDQYCDETYFVGPDGGIFSLEYADVNGASNAIVEHERRLFVVEPFTGYYDIYGAPIFLSDTLGAEKGIYRSTVVWHKGGFYCLVEGEDQLMPLDAENRAWKRHVIVGNVHMAEFIG